MNEKLAKRGGAFDNTLVNLVLSALRKDISKAEQLSMTLVRLIKDSHPEASDKIAKILSSHTVGGSPIRGVNVHPLPVDQDSQLETATLVLPNIHEYPLPILEPAVADKIQNFLDERSKIDLLFEKNIRPSNSILLVGPPGTGKTTLAYHIASALDKNLIVLDLAASISSLLGKTGHNLKKVLRYAQQTSSVLLLDEFDAIAKRRDDSSDLGELKRIVNVLLMELDAWPISSVVIATTNHPELLDRAIWRRFDHVINIDLPEKRERIALLESVMSDTIKDNSRFSLLIEPISEVLEGFSAAEIIRFTNGVRRRMVLRKEESSFACFKELELYSKNKKTKGKLCALIKKTAGSSITIREIAKMTGLSPSGAHYIISKNNLCPKTKA